MVPESPRDWPIVASDMAEIFADVERTPSLLRQRWAKVIWPPGNHELWTRPQDAVQARHAALVRMCRRPTCSPRRTRTPYAIKEVFDLRTAAIIRALELLRLIHQQAAAYGRPGAAGPEVGEHRARPEPQGHRVLNRTPSWRGNK